MPPGNAISSSPGKGESGLSVLFNETIWKRLEPGRNDTKGLVSEIPASSRVHVAEPMEIEQFDRLALHLTADGFPVHSFGTLMAELATLTRNRVGPAGGNDERATCGLDCGPRIWAARTAD